MRKSAAYWLLPYHKTCLWQKSICHYYYFSSFILSSDPTFCNRIARIYRCVLFNRFLGANLKDDNGILKIKAGVMKLKKYD